jgi:hypothetical protein
VDKHSALQFMEQLAKVIDWLERHSGAYEEPGSSRKLTTKSSQTFAPPSKDASVICDNFMQGQRRVPRNICNDPAVEAKKALTGTFRCGLSAFRKSILDCLNEADDVYIHEFCSALKETAKLYFQFDLECTFSMSAQERKISVVVSKIGGSEVFEIHACQRGSQRATAEIWKHSSNDCILTPATEQDFLLLIAANDDVGLMKD